MLRHNARYNALNAVASSTSLNLINAYVGIFAIKLGANDLQLGYLSSWPSIVAVIGVLAAAAAVARSAEKKRMIAWFHLVGRTAALGAAVVPWLPAQWRVWALIVAWVIAAMPGSVGNTILQSFLADVFPGSERTRALASRQAWSTGASMLVILISGWLLDYFFTYPLGYQVMFVASFAAALFEVYYLLKLQDPGRRPGDQGTVPSTPVQWSSYLKTFAHEPFRRFLIVSVGMHFTWQMAWPIFTRFQVTELHANNMWFSVTSVGTSATAVLSYRLWARYAERFGNRTVMPVAAIYLAAAPFLTALVPNNAWLFVVNLLTGMSVAGVTLLTLNNLFDLSVARERPLFLAVHAALVNASAAVAPMVGAYVMSVMPIRQGLLLCGLLRLTTGCGFLLLCDFAGKSRGDRRCVQN